MQDAGSGHKLLVFLLSHYKAAESDALPLCVQLPILRVKLTDLISPLSGPDSYLEGVVPETYQFGFTCEDLIIELQFAEGGQY